MGLGVGPPLPLPSWQLTAGCQVRLAEAALTNRTLKTNAKAVSIKSHKAAGYTRLLPVVVISFYRALVLSLRHVLRRPRDPHVRRGLVADGFSCPIPRQMTLNESGSHSHCRECRCRATRFRRHVHSGLDSRREPSRSDRPPTTDVDSLDTSHMLQLPFNMDIYDTTHTASHITILIAASTSFAPSRLYALLVPLLGRSSRWVRLLGLAHFLTR